jgi:hypothetical protein
VARTRLTNPAQVVALQYNPYQQAFLHAKRLRQCVTGCLQTLADPEPGLPVRWSVIDSQVCPRCGAVGMRPFRRFFLRAGRRGGKTRIGALASVEEMTVPNSKGWICAPSYPELEDYVMPNFFAALPQDWFEHPDTQWSEDRYELILPNGAQVNFRSLDDPNRGAGPGLHWVWIDEGRKIQELAWHLLRPSLTEHKGIAFVTSTPDWGEDWCHKNFFMPAEDGRPGYWACHYLTKDNPIIDPAEVEEARATMPPALFRREFEASIEFPSGTIYGDVLEYAIATDDMVREWLPEWTGVHPNRSSIVPLDPGADHPFAGLLIIPTPAGLCLVGEYEQRELMYNQHAAGIHLLARGTTPRYFIDRSQKQAAQELSQYGIFAQGAENDVDAGIQRVYAWMATRRMRIAASACPKLIKALRKYRWIEVKETEKGLTRPAPFKKDDDLPDALRYGCMSYPELPLPTGFQILVAGGRDESLLNEHQRAELARNKEADVSEDGLVRVTDDFSPVGMQGTESFDGGAGDFYL